MKNHFYLLSFAIMALFSLSLTNSLLPARPDRIVDAAYSEQNILLVYDASLDELNRALAIAQTRSLSDSSYEKAIDRLEDQIRELRRREERVAQNRPSVLQTVGQAIAGVTLFAAVVGLAALAAIYGPPPTPVYRHVKTIRVYEPYYYSYYP